MRFEDFKLERYFAEWEFTAQWMLSSSDPESMTVAELLGYAEDGKDRVAAGQRLLDLHLGYTESAGSPELRQAIAERCVSLADDDVVVTAAPEEAIFHVCSAVLEPGDHMVGITPAYQSSYSIPRALGADVTLVPLDEALAWQPDLDRIAAAIGPRTKLLCVNFPHNPTGAVLDSALVAPLLELVERTGVTLLSDEVYRGLELQEASRIPQLAELHPRAVSVNGLSKSYGLPGLRLGWILSQDRPLLRRILAAKDYTTICNSAPSEALALVAVRAADRLHERSRAQVARNLAVADAFLERHGDLLGWVRPRGGSTGFVAMSPRLPVDPFAEDLVRRRSVLITPARLYDYAGNSFRLGLGRANFADVLGLLEQHLDEALSTT